MLARTDRAKKTLEQADQILGRRAATPQLRIILARPVPEDIDETLGLPGLERIRTGI